MKFLLGTKLKMSQIFDENGSVQPVTIIQAGPVVVTQVKTKETDGYNAVQIGFGAAKAAKVAKAQKGHFKDLGGFKFVKEFRLDDVSSYKVGDKVDASAFKVTDIVTLSGTSKGKGFQGAVKRHGFAGGSRTHGQKHSEREVGTIGGGLRTRVPSGMRMAGRMGGDRITSKSIEVVQVNSEANLILVRGSVPGKPGTLVEITSTSK